MTVSSNDPKQPKFTLTLSGDVEVIAAFEPAYVRLGRVARGEKKTQTVKVVARDPGKFKITQIKPSNPGRVSAKLVEGKGGPTLEVTVTAGDKPGRLSESVMATTNLDNPKTLRLTVSGTVSNDLWTDPPRVFFSDFKEKQAQIVDVRVSSLSKKAFKLKGVKDPAGFVTGKVEQVNGQWVAHLTLATKPDKTSGKVQVRTNRKDQPVIEVPYTLGRGSGARTRSGIRSRVKRIPQPVKMRRPPPGKTQRK